MKIKLLRNTVIEGIGHVEAGSVHDVPDRIATLLVTIKKAQLVNPTAVAATTLTTTSADAVVETTDVVETATAKPQRKAR